MYPLYENHVYFIEPETIERYAFPKRVKGLRRMQAAIERFLFPAYGTCGYCQRPWNRVSPHVTKLRIGVCSGVFVLCESCWSSMHWCDRRIYYFEWWYNLLCSGRNPLMHWHELQSAVDREDD